MSPAACRHGKVSVSQPYIPDVPSCSSSAYGMHPAVAVISSPGIQLQTLAPHEKPEKINPAC